MMIIIWDHLKKSLKIYLKLMKMIKKYLKIIKNVFR